ncbi:hypothetical protein Tco_0132782, partial [Tanacetum coccineum]
MGGVGAMEVAGGWIRGVNQRNLDSLCGNRIFEHQEKRMVHVFHMKDLHIMKLKRRPVFLELITVAQFTLLLGTEVEHPEPGFELQDHKEQRIVSHLGYRKRKVGASWNEGYEVLFILEITKGAKQASRSAVGHLYHLSIDVGGLS